MDCRWFLVCAVLFGYAASVRASEGIPDVWMDDVRGEWSGKQAELSWTVSRARDTVGFRVYRCDSAGDVLLNETPVALNVFEPWREVYRLTDPAMQVNETARYRIDAVRPDGSAETLGVWPVQFVLPAPAPMKAVLPAALPPAGGESPQSGPALKVPVRSNDFYRVSFSDIASGLDWTEAAVSNAVAQTNLAMRCGERGVAYLADFEGQQILFYGWPATNRYTRTGYFWIEPGAGLQMERLAPVAVAVSSNLTFASTVDAEEDHFSMVEHSGTLREDLYFWDYFSPGRQRSFDLPLEGIATNGISLTVRLTGWYGADNEAEIRVNSAPPVEAVCSGKVDVAVSFDVDASQLSASGNQLTVKGVASLCVVDGFTVSYERLFAPADGLLRAADGGHGALGADRFADPLVMNVDDPYEPVRVANTNGVIPAGWSWPAASNTQWALREWSAIPQAVPEPAGFGAELRAETNRVDYLVIAPRALERPAQDLAETRASQGLRTAVALYEDLCDQFNGGLRSPESIREGLRYAYENWATPPRMAVLCGWGHYDYLGVLTDTVNALPTLLHSDTEFLRPADSLLADVTGDDEVPDLAIGRLPVQSEAQLDDYLDKLKLYESNGVQSAYQQMVFVADDADLGGDFSATNLELADQTASAYSNRFVSLDSQPLSTVRSEIVSAFTNGSGIIHYTGHGSYQQMAGENIFDATTAANLGGSPSPLVISLTCMISRFDLYQDSQRCLAERIVLNPVGGALATFSTPGLSYNVYASAFADVLYPLHTEDGADTLGMLILKARKQVGVLSGVQKDVVTIYTLLGDPAMKLRGGGSAGAPFWVPDYTAWRWEQFDYEELADPAVSGPSADPGESGAGNLAVYALGSSGQASIRRSEVVANGLNVSWNRRLYADDLNYTLMKSTNLTAGSLWVPVSNAVVQVVPGDDPAMEKVEVDVAMDGPTQYIRLGVEKE